jgi:mRNA-degrading endonuclease YafQ of YafQ-DinJ toxin-antitoxin module
LWRINKFNRFESAYRRLDDEWVERVDAALRILTKTSRPETLGASKSSTLRGFFAYELGRDCRILYRPDYNAGILEFHRVCSHKEVYGP